MSHWRKPYSPAAQSNTTLVASLIASLAIVAVGLTVARAQSANPNPAQSSGGLAQPPGVQDKPKTYQPANPAPDTRTAPTSSSSGVGSSSGGNPENRPKK